MILKVKIIKDYLVELKLLSKIRCSERFFKVNINIIASQNQMKNRNYEETL